MNKLYGKERKILKIIVSNYYKGNKISKFDIPKYCKYTQNEIDLILKSLYSNGYFTYSGMHYNFILTNKGLSYFSNETYNNIELCIKSIVCPIVVSIVTTLITMWLSHLL